MLLFGTVVGGAGAGVGLVGGLLAFRLFDRLSDTSINKKQIESFGLEIRSAIIGLLVSIMALLALSYGANDLHRGLIGVSCVGISFLATAVYIFGSLNLFTRYGPSILEAGEMSLTFTIVLTALLCVCGLLWITLVILGVGVLLGVTVLNGFWIYRIR